MKKNQIKKILLFIFMIGIIGVVLTGYTKLYNSQKINTSANVVSTEKYNGDLIAVTSSTVDEFCTVTAYNNVGYGISVDTGTCKGIETRLKNKCSNGTLGEITYYCDGYESSKLEEACGIMAPGNWTPGRKYGITASAKCTPKTSYVVGIDRAGGTLYRGESDFVYSNHFWFPYSWTYVKSTDATSVDIKLPTSGTKSGYAFGGIYTEADCNGTNLGTSTTIYDTASKKTFYACWTLLPPSDPDDKEAFLTLDPNGGSLISKDSSYSDLNGQTTIWTTAYSTLPVEFNLSNVTAKRSGYTFNGWGDSAGCTIGSLSTIKINTDLTYFACWTSGNTGGTVPAPIAQVPIAETIKTDFYDDPIRYVGGSGTEASASYQKVSCGDEVYITTCDDNLSGTCNITSINGIKVTGTKVYRQQLMETRPNCPVVRYARKDATYYASASNVTSKTNPKELECNAKLEFIKTPADACTYGDIIDDSQQFCEVSYKGDIIYVDRMQIGISEAVCIEDKCEPSSALKNQTSYEEKSMSVCYEYDGKGKFEVNGADEKAIFKCASGYRRVIKPDFENDTCKDLTDNDEAQSCYRTYTYTCNSVDRPKVHGTGSLVTPENVGTISIKGTDSSTKTGLKGYIINLGEGVTRDSDWKKFENSEYIASVPRHAGTHFAWVMTNDRSISYPIMLRINSDDITTTAEVGIKGPNDDLTNSLNPLKSEDGLAYLDGVTSQEYVRLSNQLMNDSLIAAGFDLFTTAYELTVDSGIVALYATLTSSDSKYVEGYEPRTINLDYGRNVAIIKIENSKGAQRSYTFIINRTDTRESVNALTDVTLSVGTINFDPYVSDYTVSVPKNTASVSINGTLESDRSAFIVGYEPRTVDLTEGVTSAVLKTISEAGITRNYVFTFIKTGVEVSSSISNSTYLSSLSIPGTEISFDKENLSYSVSIEYEIESLAVYALPESANATVEVYGSQELRVGANKVEIVVTNGSATKIYNVFINRKEDGLGVSSNTKLKTLTVKDYNIKFNPDVEDYIIKIKREKTLLLTATPESDRSEVYMYGNNDLNVFSTVRVKVIAENGDTGLYSVDIIKDVYNKKLETTIAIVGSIIILGSGIIIMVNKKRKKLQDYIEE